QRQPQHRVQRGGQPFGERAGLIATGFGGDGQLTLHLFDVLVQVHGTSMAPSWHIVKCPWHIYGVEMHEIVASNRYMTLATADASGLPWATPVWYAPDGDDALLWLSRPDARHSRNLAERPELAITIFDSRADPDGAAAVYFQAVASEAPGRIEVYSARSV